MFSNYLKIAWRTITRNRGSSFINISGLTIGMTSVILILLYVQDELRFDRFFKDSDRIYQVNLEGNFGGQEFYIGNTPPPVGAALVSNYSEIDKYTRIFKPGDAVVSSTQQSAVRSFTESRVMGVDSNFLEFFNYGLKEGNPATCLNNTNSIVLTESMAHKYFGNEPAMGKTLQLFNDRVPFTVTAVLKDIPAQSTLQFDFLTPISYYGSVKYFSWSWVWSQVMTYVHFSPAVATDVNSVRRLEAKFPEMVKVQAASAFRRIGQPYDAFLKKGGKWNFHLQPLRRVHLYSGSVQTTHTNLGDIKYVYIFSAIGIIIMLLACVNFMNLSTAQSARRSREVGIRKVLGSFRIQLVKQFLVEAILCCAFAMLAASILASLLIQPFNALSGKHLEYTNLFSGYAWIILLGIIIITGILAGSYPAFYLTSFNPVRVLKGMSKVKNSFGNILLRNGLVIFQFSASTALIVCTIIVYRQMEFARNRKPGFNKENVLIIKNAERLARSEQSFRDEIAKIPGVINASISTGAPASSSFNDFYTPEIAGDEERVAKDIALSSYMADDYFIPSLQMQLVAGRAFSREFSDSDAVILNETAVRQIGWKNPIGKYITYPGGDYQRFRVIGVLKDFNVESIHTAIGAFALFHVSSKSYEMPFSYILVRVKPDGLDKTMDHIQKQWAGFSGSMPFDYSFMDTEFDALYRSEQRMGVVFGIFTLLSIFVACLGLFGLTAYTAERRTKEIGVRKVLGASNSSVVAMLSKDTVKMILLAEVVAFPLAWYVMNKWLEDYAESYRIHIGWWVFALAGLTSLCIALGTVGYQAVKAAMANPVNSLRSE